MINHIHIPELDKFKKVSRVTTDKGRVYSCNGREYPSITTVLGRMPKPPEFWAWRERVGAEEANRIGAKALRNGTKMHKLFEDFVDNKPLEKPLMPVEQLSYDSVTRVLMENLGDVYCQETYMYSDYLKVAGQVDMVAEWNRIPSIIDYKTSTRVKTIDDIPNYFIQACAYSIMFEECTTVSVPQLVIVMTVAGDPKPLIFVQKRNDWAPRLMDILDKFA